VTIWRVVVPELVSAAVWLPASGDAAPGFNSMLRGRSSSAAMAGRLKAMIAMLAKIVVHRDMGVSSGSALLPGYQIIRSQRSEISDQRSEFSDQNSVIF
jgi:hypothetical protein